MLIVATDGREIVFSKADPGEHAAPDLYAYVPGEPIPTLLFRDPNRHAQLNTIAVKDGRYAFEEVFTDASGSVGGWRLWFKTSRTAEPFVLDSGDRDPPDFPVPGVVTALTDTQVTWPSVHLVGGVVRWALRSFDFATRRTRTIIEAPGTETEFWFPDVDASNRLVYGTVEYASDGAPAYHVYLANLGDDPLRPQRLDTDGHATAPVLTGDPDTIVRKEVQPPMSVATWGTLYRYSIATSTLRAMYFDTEDRLDYQAAGNRYVTGWEWFDDTLRAYDLRSDTSLVIESHPPAPTSPIGLHMAVVAGDLLVYIRGDSSKPGGKNKWLCYVQLPPG